MRRPPDKDVHGTVTDRDVDTSNATLNTLFRGARQKPWMLGSHAAPIRPTPRPVTSKSAVSQAPPAQRSDVNPPANTSVGPTLLSFQSPTLNGSRATLTSRPPNDEIRSPAPITEHARIESNWVAESQPLVPPRPIPQATPPVLAMNSSSSAQARSVARTEIRDSMSPTSSPSISVHAPPGNRPSPISSAVVSQSVISSTLSEQVLAEAQISSTAQGPNSTHALASSVPGPLQIPQPQVLHQNIDNQGPSQIQMNSISPRTVSSNLPSTSQHQQQQARNPGSAYPSPNKRQRIHEAVMPSLKSRIALINAHIATFGGTQDLNNNLERPRFQLLTDACNTEDAFYVALHQLFCLWDFNRNEVLNNNLLPPQNTLSLAFRVLGQLIRDNEGLAPNHLQWFAQFPSPLNDLLRTSEPYRRTMNHVGIFLGNLTVHWADISKLCTSRGYPPLVDELVTRLGLLSPILQHVVFTAARRNLGVQDDQYGQEMERLFLQDKQGHQELAIRYNTGRPPTEKEVHMRNQTLIDSYVGVYDQVRRQKQLLVSGLHMGSPLARTPIVPSNGDSPTSVSTHDHTPSRSSIEINQNWNNNAQAPDLSGAWNQHVQPMHIHSSGNLNTSTSSNTRQTSSVASQRPYENTPSPTFMQNLSMNSPAANSPSQQGFQFPSPALRNNNVHTHPGQSSPHQNQNSIVNQYPVQAEANDVNEGQAQIARMQQQQQQQIMLQQQRQARGRRNAARPQQNQQHAVQQVYPYILTPQQVVAQHQTQQATMQQQQSTMQMHAHQINQHQALQSTGPPGLPGQQHQHQITQQHVALQQQVLNMNRAAQLRSNSVTMPQQQFHSRNNGVTTNSRSNTHVLSAQVPVTLGLTPEQINQLEVHAYRQSVNSQDPSQRVNRQLIPPHNYVHPAQPLNPDLNALHQAHIRSPRLVPTDFEPSDEPEEDHIRRFYQTVKDFALEPTKIPIDVGLSKFEFIIPEEVYALTAQDVYPSTDKLAHREFRRGTLQYRLRCIQTRKEVTMCRKEDWVISDTMWPESIFIEINGDHLEIRRKTHHGKDLPIDITRFIARPEQHRGSVNQVRISVPRLRKLQKDTWYFIAVEVIEILRHDQILNMVSEKRVPSSETLAGIIKSMATTDDDDDFAMVVSDLSVDLADPFTAQIFTVPVRGSSCLHRECFDLETFLLTRNSKPKRPNQPSMIDVWKCPLCGKDARPYSLEIIDFLVDVRKILEIQGNLDVRAILISVDGTWRPKSEPQPLKRKASNGLEDDDTSDDDIGTVAKKQNMLPKSRQSSAQLDVGSRRQSTPRRPIEVIELDD